MILNSPGLVVLANRPAAPFFASTYARSSSGGGKRRSSASGVTGGRGTRILSFGGTSKAEAEWLARPKFGSAAAVHQAGTVNLIRRNAEGQEVERRNVPASQAAELVAAGFESY